MRSTVAIAALLALIACKKQQSPAPPPAQEESSTEVSAPAAAAEPAPAAEPAEEKIAVEEALVAKYVAYEKELLVAIREQMAKVQEAAAEVDKNSTASTLRATSKIASAGQEMGAREEELLKRHGITKAQVIAVRDVVGEVIPGRMVMKNAGGQKAMIQQMRDSLKNMPADKRAEAEAEIVKMETSIDDMVNAVEARKKFGDAAVDAVLKHEEELTNLQNDTLKSLGGNK